MLTCLESVAGERAALPGLRAVVVDNCSGDHSVDLLTPALGKPGFADWVEFLPLALNGGFGWGNNQAILHLLQSPCPPDAVLLLNPDTRIEPGAIVALVRDLERHPDAGAIGSQLVNEDGSLAGSAFRFPSPGREFVRGCNMSLVGRMLGIAAVLVPADELGPVDWVTGASVLLRTAALRQAGLFDTGFFLYFEEVELMHRLLAKNWKCYVCPASRVLHLEAASTGVGVGAPADQPAPPAYYLASRYRFFSLTRGAFGCALAVFAWLIGTIAGQVLATIARRPFPRTILRERRALLGFGLAKALRRCTPAITRAGDQPGQSPAWERSRCW